MRKRLFTQRALDVSMIQRLMRNVCHINQGVFADFILCFMLLLFHIWIMGEIFISFCSTFTEFE